MQMLEVQCKNKEQMKNRQEVKFWLENFDFD